MRVCPRWTVDVERRGPVEHPRSENEVRQPGRVVGMQMRDEDAAKLRRIERGDLNRSAPRAPRRGGRSRRRHRPGTIRRSRRSRRAGPERSGSAFGVPEPRMTTRVLRAQRRGNDECKRKRAKHWLSGVYNSVRRFAQDDAAAAWQSLGPVRIFRTPMYATCLFCNRTSARTRRSSRSPSGSGSRSMPRRADCGSSVRVRAMEPLAARGALGGDRASGAIYRDTRSASRRTTSASPSSATARRSFDRSPLRPEFAAWRYGDQFGRRRKRQMLIAARGVALLGGVGGGGVVGRRRAGYRRRLDHAGRRSSGAARRRGGRDTARSGHGLVRRAPATSRVGDHARSRTDDDGDQSALQEWAGAIRGTRGGTSRSDRHPEGESLRAIRAQRPVRGRRDRARRRTGGLSGRLDEACRPALDAAPTENHEDSGGDGEGLRGAGAIAGCRIGLFCLPAEERLALEMALHEESRASRDAGRARRARGGVAGRRGDRGHLGFAARVPGVERRSWPEEEELTRAVRGEEVCISDSNPSHVRLARASPLPSCSSQLVCRARSSRRASVNQIRQPATPRAGADDGRDHAARPSDPPLPVRRRLDAGRQVGRRRQLQGHRDHRRRGQATRPHAGGRQRHVLPGAAVPHEEVHESLAAHGRRQSARVGEGMGRGSGNARAAPDRHGAGHLRRRRRRHDAPDLAAQAAGKFVVLLPARAGRGGGAGAAVGGGRGGFGAAPSRFADAVAVATVDLDSLSAAAARGDQHSDGRVAETRAGGGVDAADAVRSRSAAGFGDDSQPADRAARAAGDHSPHARRPRRSSSAVDRRTRARRARAATSRRRSTSSSCRASGRATSSR